ncbi:MAG: extracellular solute-binding protein [Clostridiales bacterium]|nr:extracellular solute-binding protein [Clostridiales bacterium]
MLKRTLCLVLSLLLVLSVAPVALGEETIQFPLVSEPLTLHFMAPRPSDYANGYADMTLFKEYEEMTGIHIEWEEVPASGWGEKIQLVLNSVALPDVIYSGGISASDAARYGAEGTILPLNDLIENHTVNLKRLLAERPDIKKLITSPDGNIYGLPSIDESLSTQVAGIMGMNMTWLGNLGLEIPTTLDEFTAVLRAFKAQDANKNGDPNDEIPLSFRSTDAGNRTTWIGSFFGPFGVVDDETHIMIKDGKVLFTPEQEGFKEALQYFHSLYAEGLMDPESFTQDDSTFFAKARSPEGIGASYVFSTFDLDQNDNTYNNYDLIDPIKGNEGKSLVNLAVYIAGVSQNRYMITADCKDPVAAIKWIDYWCDDFENALTVRFGYEGDSWKWLNEDKTQFTENATAKNGETVNQAYVSQFTPYTQAVMWELQDLWRKKKNSAPYFIERAEKANGSYRAAAVTELWPKVAFDEETNERYAEINTDLRSYIESTMCNFMINGFTDAEYDAFIQKCHDLHSEELIEIYQTRYDSFMAS